jgi:hypothetical protein
MPSYNIDFYWPTSYYDPSSQVEIIYDTTSSYMFPGSNSGNTTEDLTNNSMFNSRARYIPDAPSSERSLKMFMRERRVGDGVVEKWNQQDHEGPTIILVRTPTTTTSRYSYATSTGRSGSSYNSNDDGDGKKQLSPGAIAGIVMGIAMAGVLLLVCCFRQVKETSSAEQRRIHAIIDAEEQKRMNQQAMELIQQQSVQREVDGVNGVRMDVGGETLPVYTEAPPKYMP